MSISTFTASPGRRSGRLVWRQLCGMMLQAKPASPAWLTVSEMPSTAIEPLTAISGARLAGTATSRRCDSPTGSSAVISPIASTWPNTMWPPISSPIRSERSRLTLSPSRQRPTVVTSRVAPEASTANQPSPLSTAVKQMPEVAIEPPSGISASGSRVLMVSRRPWSPARSCATSTIWPTSVMMPVNMALPRSRRYRPRACPTPARGRPRARSGPPPSGCRS